MPEDNQYLDKEEKAAYNQSRNITEILGNLLGSYVYHMNKGDLAQSVKAIRRILDIISAKIKEEESKGVDDKIDKIEKELPTAVITYQHNGGKYYRNPKLKKEMEHQIEELFRIVNKLQDRYGYGMVSLDDPRFAVLQR